jgi:hypothetical protein
MAGSDERTYCLICGENPTQARKYCCGEEVCVIFFGLEQWFDLHDFVNRRKVFADTKVPIFGLPVKTEVYLELTPEDNFSLRYHPNLKAMQKKASDEDDQEYDWTEDKDVKKLTFTFSIPTLTE